MIIDPHNVSRMSTKRQWGHVHVGLDIMLYRPFLINFAPFLESPSSIQSEMIYLSRFWDWLPFQLSGICRLWGRFVSLFPIASSICC